jgi:anti-sigma B factor antagonist
MKVTTSPLDNAATVITIEGSFKDVGDVEAVRATVGRCIEDQQTRVILDLGGVTYLSSIAVGELVRTHVTMQRRGGAFIVCGLNERVYTILTVTKVNRILRVAGSLDEAATLAATAP